MAERPPTQPPDDLERALRDLSQRLDWPSEPNMLPAVRARLAPSPPRRSLLSGTGSATSAPRLAWATAALIAIVAIALFASESTRSTIADRLGVPGVSISSEQAATLTPGSTLEIGTPTTIDDAVRRFGADLVLPPESALGLPDGIFVLEADGVVQVSYVYRPRPDLPEVGETGVGLLISQFEGDTNESFVQKQLGPDTSIEMTSVNQQPAFWLSGGPHVFYYERPDGEIREETIRLAANVLLWELGGTTLRVETALGRDSVVAIAEAMSTRV